MGFLNLDEVIFSTPTPIYLIELFWRGLTDRDMDNIERKFHYHQQRYFPFCSWAVAGSEIEGDSARKGKERTGKRGRPKTVVYGNKVERHAHIPIIGDETCSGYSFAKKMCAILNKSAGKTVAKLRNTRSILFIDYCIRQSYRFHTGGKFNWRGCKSGFAWVEDGLWKDEGIISTKAEKEENREALVPPAIGDCSENKGDENYLAGLYNMGIERAMRDKDNSVPGLHGELAGQRTHSKLSVGVSTMDSG